ncbi:hypothetical protein ACN28E_23670 [Archangium lansingense]|uniref:hypothetical protein n=1 Tax=Archangium lansingense TaxID=2995310 RepID=UPI003B76B230
MRRLGHLEQVARLWRELEDDHWLPDYADGLGEQIIGLRHAGISNLLPKRLQPEGNGYSCVDEHGQPWGRLRGQGSLVSRIETYMEEHGTSYDWISDWMGEVSGDSWSQWGKAMRIFWVRQRDQKKVKVLEHYWNNPSDPVTAAKTCSGLYASPSKVGLGYEKEPQLKRAWQIWHGFVQELLACTDFPNNDREARTVRLIRTENDAGLKANKLTPFEPKKDSEIKRGVCESSSIFKAFVNAGPHITLQTVPHIRVITCYFTERTGGANRCCLKEDHENEFIFLTHGIRCDYEPSGGSSTQVESDEDKYKGLFSDYAPFGSSSTQTQSNADKYKGLFDE